MEIDKKSLIIFDVDGTLVESWTENLLPNVRETIAALPTSMKFAFVANQGGPALRSWMEKEGWGNPQGLPTFPEVRDRLISIRETLFGSEPWPILVSSAYQTKDGKWAPIWDESETITCVDKIRFYSHQGQDWRKPNPGMLLAHSLWFELPYNRILFVGKNVDDQAAAKAVMMPFMWAKDFFGWIDNRPFKEIENGK